MESFGRYLKNEREHRGVSIEDIARATKISAGQLRSLESDDLAALPTTAYVKGFIRAYSRHIGIDPDDTLLRFERYLDEIGQEEGVVSESMQPNQGLSFKRETPQIGIAIAAGGLILLAIVVLLVLLRACGNDTEVRFNAPAVRTGLKPDPTAPLTSNTELNEVPSTPEEERYGNVIPPLPSVPPDAFRVRRTAPPPYTPASSPSDGVSEDSMNPGGGNIP